MSLAIQCLPEPCGSYIHFVARLRDASPRDLKFNAPIMFTFRRHASIDVIDGSRMNSQAA